MNLLVAVIFLGAFAMAQPSKVPTAQQQIASAVLPLPQNMQDKAEVWGYTSDLSLIKLRPGSNGMVCTATRPGSEEFDVRCYHESFMPVILRLREIRAQNMQQDEINRAIDADVKAGKLVLPEHPAAGYRMLGPMSAYNPATNTVGEQIHSWQSIHFPYKTAAEIGLPEEGQVVRTMPYVMSSGTFWSHVMIEHD